MRRPVSLQPGRTEPMLGELFIYDQDRRLVAFETVQPGGQLPEGTLVYVGGLTEGLLTSAYVSRLAATLGEADISVTQFVMSSSYRQYGISSLSQDAAELATLIEHLHTVRGRKKIFLLGHSTGCQDIFWYLGHALKTEHPVYGVNVQAPVSDRDYFSWAQTEKTTLALDTATKMLAEGRGDELLPQMFGDVPMTAYRTHSLLARLGDDDFFSADLTLEECRGKFSKLPDHPTMRSFNFSYSLQDEYVPCTETEPRASRVSLLVEKLIQSYPFTREPILLPGGHDLSSHEGSIEEFCARLLDEVLAAFSVRAE